MRISHSRRGVGLLASTLLLVATTVAPAIAGVDTWQSSNTVGARVFLYAPDYYVIVQASQIKGNGDSQPADHTRRVIVSVIELDPYRACGDLLTPSPDEFKWTAQKASLHVVGDSCGPLHVEWVAADTYGSYKDKGWFSFPFGIENCSPPAGGYSVQYERSGENAVAAFTGSVGPSALISEHAVDGDTAGAPGGLFRGYERMKWCYP